MIKFLIKYIGIDLYAPLAIINSFSIWMLLGDLGFGATFQNLYTRFHYDSGARLELLRIVRRIQAWLILFILPVSLLISPFVGRFLFHGQFNPSVNFVGALLISNLIWGMTAVASIHYKLLYSADRGHFSNILPSIASLASLLLVVNLGFFGSIPEELFYLAILFISLPQLIASCFGIYMFDIVAGGNSHFKFDFRQSSDASQFQLRPITRQAFNFLLTSLLIQAVLNSDYIIMSQISSAFEIAQYKVVNSLYAFLYSLIYASLLLIWPFCSRALGRGHFEAVQRKLRKAVFFGVLALIGFMLFLIFFRKEISSLLLGDELLISFGLVIAFSLLYVARLIGDAYAVALASIDKTKVFIAYLPIQFLIGVLFSVAFGLRFGVVGIVFGLFISFCLTHTWVNAWYLKRMQRNALLSGAR